MQFKDSLKVDEENPSAVAGAVQTASVVEVNSAPVNLDPHGNLTAAWTAGNYECAYLCVPLVCTLHCKHK
jgi:hypothetical protein